VDDGSGTATVWRIEDMAMVEVEESMRGQFFAGDAYVVLYEYTNVRPSFVLQPVCLRRCW